MYEGVDTVARDQELAYQDVVPMAWRPLTGPLGSEIVMQIADRNLRLLQAIAALDEHSQAEKADDKSPYAADILRLDMKVNLLLDLVGRILIANQPRPIPLTVCFNATGATWQAIDAPPALDEAGIVEIYLKDCLVEPLQLLGCVSSVSVTGIVKVTLQHPGDTIADLIEKLAFRRHRRQVAARTAQVKR